MTSVTRRIVHVEMGVMVDLDDDESDEVAEALVFEQYGHSDGVTYFCMRTQEVPVEGTR
jgi:hypothetical protein